MDTSEKELEQLQREVTALKGIVQFLAGRIDDVSPLSAISGQSSRPVVVEVLNSVEGRIKK